MGVTDEQQTAGTGQAEGGAQVSPPADPGQPAAPESAGETTGLQAPEGTPTAPEAQPEKWDVNTDLSKLSAEQLSEGLKDPENAEIHKGHLLRDRDYREKTTKLAEQTRALEDIRGQTITLDQQPANPYAQTPTTPPPAQTQPQEPNAEQTAQDLIREFQEQHPEGDGQQYATWREQRLQQTVDSAVEAKVQPLLDQQQQAEGQRMVAEVERQYAAVTEEFPHAAEPGVQDAVYEKLRQWDPSNLTDQTVREAYVAVNADRFVPRQAGEQPQQPPATQAPAQPQQPTPPGAQPLPPAARKGTPATPVYDNPEDQIAAMLADKELAGKLDFPGTDR